MAVTFKVPASPKKDIFVIDEFMGVDLTNTGANIEETRSPNAENMVRYVPGKVRKRTGYAKEILFGKDINVNYAVGTSSDEQNIVINEDEVDEWVLLYELIQQIKSKDGDGFTVYVEFDYMAQEDFYIFSNNHLVNAAEEWTHYSRAWTFYASGYINWISIKSAVPQMIYIKNFSFMRGKDSNYEWSPAPHYFVERETNDPVYGCHVLRTGNMAGNRVVNVNRALGTSNEFVTYSLPGTVNPIPGYTEIYQLGECVYKGEYPKPTITIDMDYILSGDNVTLYVAGAMSSSTVVRDTDGEEKHFKYSIKAGSYTHKAVWFYTEGSATIQVKNFSVCYETDENYEWSPAPEDGGGTFHTSDIYYISRKNYADVDSYTSSVSSSSSTEFSASCTMITGTNPDKEDIMGFCRVAFDVYTATDKVLSEVEVSVISNDNYKLEWRTFSANIINQHFEFYVSAASADHYCNRIKVKMTHTATGANASINISNIEVNAISPRSSYDISPKNYIYHVGSDFYLRASNSKDFTNIYSGANKHLSQSWQLDKTLFILDGQDIYSYQIGDQSVTPISGEDAYIPLITIAKSPNGGGVSYEPINMLQAGFYEQFVVTNEYQNEKSFHLSFGNLDSTETRAWVLHSTGNWEPKVEGYDYSIDRGTGIVTFVAAPGSSPLVGEDNVRILAYRTVSGYRERVANCTIGTLFGVGGASDRLFISGNPDYPNWDFYSERNNATYFPDTGYASLGSSSSSIVGYSIVNNYLATFKDGGDLTQSVFIREGDLVKNEDSGVSEPAFKLINTLQGHGVIAPYAFGNLQTEPVFLTKAGIFAITAQDITGEKYSQNRSFYLNGTLTKEDHMENAVATVYNDMYILALNNQLYILDGLQATRTDRSEPYATRQYVGFHCTNVPAICLWNDDALWFGTNDGRVCRFNTDIESLESYNDDGKAIYCCWETPDLDGKLFYKNKTFRYFAIRMMKALRTSVKLYSQKLGAWSFIKEDTSSGVVFDFASIDFSNFSFSTDSSEKVVHTKVRVKKVDKARFRVENGNKNEPFGLFDLALEYIESGNYKG